MKVPNIKVLRLNLKQQVPKVNQSKKRELFYNKKVGRDEHEENHVNGKVIPFQYILY